MPAKIGVALRKLLMHPAHYVRGRSFRGCALGALATPEIFETIFFHESLKLQTLA